MELQLSSGSIQPIRLLCWDEDDQETKCKGKNRNPAFVKLLLVPPADLADLFLLVRCGSVEIAHFARRPCKAKRLCCRVFGNGSCLRQRKPWERRCLDTKHSVVFTMKDRTFLMKSTVSGSVAGAAEWIGLQEKQSFNGRPLRFLLPVILSDHFPTPTRPSPVRNPGETCCVSFYYLLLASAERTVAAAVTHQRGEASLDTDWLFHSTDRTEVLRFYPRRTCENSQAKSQRSSCFSGRPLTLTLAL